jgi:hypothetical protein
MRAFQTVASFLDKAWQQLTYSSKTPPGIRFTRTFQQKARDWGLTEADARDVYYHGEQIKEHMLVRKYSGYEIGIWYFTDPHTGQPVVTSIWKQERR